MRDLKYTWFVARGPRSVVRKTSFFLIISAHFSKSLHAARGFEAHTTEGTSV